MASYTFCTAGLKPSAFSSPKYLGSKYTAYKGKYSTFPLRLKTTYEMQNF